MIGYAGLVAHDAAHGTGYAEDLLPRFRESVEFEFSRPDGRPITVRASRAGISVPGIGASTVNEAATAFWLSPILHDVATRHWLLTRDNVVGRPGGTPCWQSPVIDRMDVGNYRMTWGPLTYGFGLAAAREMGDSEAVDALEKSLAEVAPVEIVDGAAQFPGSTTANLMMGIGLFGGERAWHDLVAYGLPKEQQAWPVLEWAPYPRVLVARAVSDGRALDLVLYPGNGAGPVTLTFGRLAPNRPYSVRGTDETIMTDGEGRASMTLVLEDRCELQVTPQ